MKHFSISDHCRWIKGITGSAIYDLKQNQVYSVNKDGTDVLGTVLSGGGAPPGSLRFLEALEQKGLLNDHSVQVVEYNVKPQLRYVWLELTNHCNCRCLHCYGAFGYPDRKDIADELTTDEWKKAIDQVRRLGGSAVQFIGGEPLIHRDFCELLRYASESGLKRIDIFTNAYFMTEKTADLIAETKASVRVSLYGYNAETHDAITQCPGSFERLDRALDMLRERNIPVRIAVVLMLENQGILPRIQEYIRAKGLRFTGYDIVRNVTHSAQASHAVTDPEIRKKRLMCKPDFKTSPYTFARNHQWNSCWFGKLAITAKGDVIPCIFARDLPCGNIRKDSAESIREKLLQYWRITKDSVEGCRDCEYRYACDDCRPLSMGEGGGLYGKYPRCLYVPETCRWECQET